MAILYDTVQTDVLVVGGGGAACRAALEADKAGADTVLAVKGAFASIGVRGSGATAGGVSDRGGVQYPGLPGIQGFDPGGVPIAIEQDYSNIIQLGLGMTDPKLARVMAERSGEIINPLVEDWSREVVPRQWGMKSHGIPMMFGLTRMLRASGVKVMEHTMVCELLIEDGRVAGAVAVDEFTGKATVIKAGAVFLGSGGMAGLFKHTTSAPECTGDGHAMGFRAGAQLMNLEFKQIFPGVIYPTFNHFSAWWFVPHVRIYNALGEAYIEKYLPEGITLEMVYQQRGSHGPFSARDSASRYFDVATVMETRAGRANEHDALYVDLTDPRVKDPLPRPRHDYFYYRGVRYLEEPIQFNICFHCSNGGLRLDENGMSTVPGLYAAGETAAGPHGANRLAGHMLGMTQVFGALAGRHAGQSTAGKSKPEPSSRIIEAALNKIESLNHGGTEKPAQVIKDLKQLCWDNLLVPITQDSIDTALAGILEIKQNRMDQLMVEGPDDLVQALELHNLVTVGELLARATGMRKESRGDLYRDDYPQRDDANWLKVITINNRDGQVELATEVIDPAWSDREGDMQGYRWG